ncbi:MAG TPA: AMP-binding protein, partial [Afifellaceae bacterium]|nr:AMP-binding protein [Afifellaceae bacterium]
MLPVRQSYQALRRDFRWQIPPRFNIASACLGRAAGESEAPAIVNLLADGRVESWTAAMLARDSARLANAFAAHGVGRGDRVAILLPQMPETAVTHLAAWRLGAVTVPLSMLFGVDALAYRLGDCGAAALVTNRAGADKVAGLRNHLEKLRLVIAVDGAGEGAEDWQGLLGRALSRQQPADTGPDDPAVMVYTSGTTGPPKGALHGHRVLLGHLPGVQMSHEFLPQPGDRLWTPADWAWAGGLFNVLLPALYFGIPVVAHRAERFDPEAAWRLMERQAVRNVFIPPTALKMLRGVAEPRGRFDLKLRTVASGGESLGRETLEWGRSALGLTI